MKRAEFLLLFRKHLKHCRKCRKWREKRAQESLLTRNCPFAAGCSGPAAGPIIADYCLHPFKGKDERLYQNAVNYFSGGYYRWRRLPDALINAMIDIMEEDRPSAVTRMLRKKKL